MIALFARRPPAAFLILLAAAPAWSRSAARPLPRQGAATAGARPAPVLSLGPSSLAVAAPVQAPGAAVLLPQSAALPAIAAPGEVAPAVVSPGTAHETALGRLDLEAAGVSSAESHEGILARLDSYFFGRRRRAEGERVHVAGSPGPRLLLRGRDAGVTRPPRAGVPYHGLRRAQAGSVTLPALGSFLAASAVSIAAGALGTGWLVSAMGLVAPMLVLLGGYVGGMSWLEQRGLGGLALVLALPFLGGAIWASLQFYSLATPALAGLVSLSDIALLGGVAAVPASFMLLRRALKPLLLKLGGMGLLGAMLSLFGFAFGAGGAVNAALGLLPSTHFLSATGAALAASLAAASAALAQPAVWVAAMTGGAWIAAVAAGFVGLLLGSVPWGRRGYGWSLDVPGAAVWGLSAAAAGAGAWILAAGAGGLVGWFLLAAGSLLPGLRAVGWLLRRAFTWEPARTVNVFPGKDYQRKLKAARKAFDRAAIADGRGGRQLQGLIYGYADGRGPSHAQIAELREAVAASRPGAFDTLVLLARRMPGGAGEPAVIVVREVYREGALTLTKTGASIPGVGTIPYKDWLGATSFADRPSD